MPATIKATITVTLTAEVDIDREDYKDDDSGNQMSLQEIKEQLEVEVRDDFDSFIQNYDSKVSTVEVKLTEAK